MIRLIALCFWLAAALAPAALPAQNLEAAREAALRFLRSTPAQFNLSPEDVSDVRITDTYFSKNNGLTHVWLQQQLAGIPVHNGLFGLHIRPDGSVLHLGHRFVPGLAKRANTTLPSLSAAQALQLTLAQIGLDADQLPAVKYNANGRNWLFDRGAQAKSDIPVQACFEMADNGSPRLAWSIALAPANSTDVWTICVDAQNGQILSRYNRTLSCSADPARYAGAYCPEGPAQPAEDGRQKDAQRPAGAADETYRVFALPVESPNFGSRILLTNPADPLASPFGWLDDNGTPGPEYTYTRGNNVWAFQDIANDNIPAVSESADGGPGLNFDFPYNPDAEPAGNLNAAITNLFYANNAMHDFTYHFGFDEAAGNFQMNNYGHGGAGQDPVLAQALDGAGNDNAQFVITPDGDPGIMLMYQWGRRGYIVQVNAPLSLAGAYFGQPSNTGGGSNSWGGAITGVPLTGAVVLTDDGTTLNCTPPLNNLQGKIALADRGDCAFSLKAYNAQQAGAIACIICNTEDGVGILGPGTYGGLVNIPVAMITKSDCEKMRKFAGNGLNISLVQPPASGPDFLDAGFDNGIMNHEYAHGISGRLTGGPGNINCLNNREQMGEGWSDFFALATTVKPGDDGANPRGLGTYIYRQPGTGTGIRRFPYSTDMSVNPLTLEDIAANPEIHALGEVWTAAVWDMYWAFVEKYGYDPDINHPNSGNARAVQLVMDGLKLQPCLPGFIDGRDAILAADAADYGGVDSCLISAVFARRGMGYFAKQGDSNTTGDYVESFDPIPVCVKTLKIKKETATPLIKAGEQAAFSITVTNHKDETVTGVVVTDPLPAGLTLVSATNGGVDQGGVVVWNLGSLAPGQTATLAYTAKTGTASNSTLYFREDMESAAAWSSVSLEPNSSLVFSLQSDSVKVGNLAWKAVADAAYTDQVLRYVTPLAVTGARPVMRFWHNYKSQAGADAGFVEFQRKGESKWNRVSPDKVFRGAYSGKIQYQSFAIAALDGFSGDSRGWVRSYFTLDDFAGQDITFRFRFGSDNNTVVPGGGWYVDQVEMLDMVNFNSEACIVTAQGDQACAKAPEGGVIVDTDIVSGDTAPAYNDLGLQVQPNPAQERLILTIGHPAPGPVEVYLFSADGRAVAHQRMERLYAGQAIALELRGLPAGVYALRVESSEGNGMLKVVIR